MVLRSDMNYSKVAFYKQHSEMKSNIFGNILKTKDLIIVYQMVLFLDHFLLILQIFNWDSAFFSKAF